MASESMIYGTRTVGLLARMLEPLQEEGPQQCETGDGTIGRTCHVARAFAYAISASRSARRRIGALDRRRISQTPGATSDQ